ncbi:MAG: hypothetical protein AAF628_33035 [Planctomycetota bacterium]
MPLNVRGAPGSPWVLYASVQRGRTPLPFGTLVLAPFTILPAGLGVLDASGSATVTFPVPGNPRFIGATSYWQALVTNPTALTNLETTTFTGY